MSTPCRERRIRMCNHTAVAKAIVITERTLAIALLTIGLGVKHTLAGSDQPTGLNFTPISSEAVLQHGSPAGPMRRSNASHRRHTAQVCRDLGELCNSFRDCCSRICRSETLSSPPECDCLSTNDLRCTTDLNCCSGYFCDTIRSGFCQPF
jgi:hypothetical protein